MDLAGHAVVSDKHDGLLIHWDADGQCKCASVTCVKAKLACRLMTKQRQVSNVLATEHGVRELFSLLTVC